MMKKIIFLPLLSVGMLSYFAFNLATVRLLLNDTSMSNNDTMLVTADIGAASNVSLFGTASDTVSVKVQIYYSVGAGSQRILVPLPDTLGVSGTTTAYGSRGKVLRGFGLATDLIPGGSYLYLKCAVNLNFG